VKIERQAGRRRLPAFVVSFLASSSRPAARRVESRGEGSWKEFPTGPGQDHAWGRAGVHRSPLSEVIDGGSETSPFDSD